MPLVKMVRHEARQMAVDRTLAAVVAALALVVAYGVSNGASWASFQRRVLDGVAREEAARMEALGKRIGSAGEDRGVPADQVGLALGVREASMPPGPLATLAIGQADLYPYHATVTTASRQASQADDEIENPAHLLSGRFDLGFVIVALYPLAILALGYNLLSAEKEQGTLVLILSQPVRPGTLVLAKVLARGAVVLGLSLAISLAGYALAGGRPSGDGLARLGLWVAVVVAYGAFWFALAVTVNAFGRSSATNALALAGIWLLVVAVIPALANVFIRATYPVPSRVELIQAIRSASDKARAEGPRLSEKFLEAHPELARGRGEANEFAVQTLAVQEATEAGVADVLARFESQLVRQQGLVDRFRFLSPAIAALEALQDVAGTGSARYRHFVGQVEAFHARWREFFRPRILRGEPIRAEDLGHLPAFSFREEPLGAVAGRVAIGLAGLVVPALAVGLLGRRRLRRFPIVG
ncbi:ABC transporter permease [Tundrisphaera sp. TA3]|uniref:ABC transporter permease n=1 Tax=Tundrisphaera sp. TA3 TaxID=3435775 RepID=UPI003EC05E8D